MMLGIPMILRAPQESDLGDGTFVIADVRFGVHLSP
jgi:hypothetical protein